MSQEIIEGIHTIEREKGIEEGILISALEDATPEIFSASANASFAWSLPTAKSLFSANAAPA